MSLVIDTDGSWSVATWRKVFRENLGRFPGATPGPAPCDSDIKLLRQLVAASSRPPESLDLWLGHTYCEIPSGVSISSQEELL